MKLQIRSNKATRRLKHEETFTRCLAAKTVHRRQAACSGFLLGLLIRIRNGQLLYIHGIREIHGVFIRGKCTQNTTGCTTVTPLLCPDTLPLNFTDRHLLECSDADNTLSEQIVFDFARYMKILYRLIATLGPTPYSEGPVLCSGVLDSGSSIH